MIVYVLLGILPALGVVVLAMSRPKKNPELYVSLLQFRAQGKAAGFSSAEIKLLKTMVEQSGRINPLSLFQSTELIDQCIRSLVRSERIAGNKDPVRQNLVERLYEYRKQIEIEAPKQKTLSSREIEAGQNLRVVADSVIYQSQVIKNTEQHILATRPVNPNMRSTPVWQGRNVSIYFWKEGDAGYVFDSDILGEALFKGAMAIQIGHTNNLFRSQKRRSPRVKVHKSTYLYLLNDAVSVDALETKPGLKCFVEDISDTGCAVTVGGRASKGLRVKLQFELNKKPFCMSGTVRSVGYNGETNRSLLHIEADPLSQEARNAIFAEMFDVMPSR
jgi:c-di-GMP-binding flagellar brake protein YcgR